MLQLSVALLALSQNLSNISINSLGPNLKSPAIVKSFWEGVYPQFITVSSSLLLESMKSQLLVK